MIKLTIAEKDFEIASSWEDVTFGQYINVIDVQKDTFSTIEKQINIIASLSKDREALSVELMKLDIKDFNTLSEHFEWIAKDDIEELSKSTDENKVFQVGDKKYKLKSNYDKLSMGEASAIEMMMQHNKNLNPLEVAFGVLFREIDENGEEIEFDNDLFADTITNVAGEVPLLDVLKNINFFLSGEKSSTKKDTKAFSIQDITTPKG